MLVMARKCIQIEDQLYTVITAMNKVRRRSTLWILSHYPIGKERRRRGDVDSQQ